MSTRIIVLCGPPGSGKTTYVGQRVRRGDLVVDTDAIFQALSGLHSYDKPDCLVPFACEARDAILARLARPSSCFRAWVIASAARLADRLLLRARLRPETVIVFETPAEECLARIDADPARANRGQSWEPFVRQWWAQYEPCPLDDKVTG